MWGALLLGVSAAFVLWLSVSVVVAAVRLAHLAPQYLKWRRLSELERRTMVLVPGLCLLAYWADYQRMLGIYSLVLHHWKAIPDYLSLLHLMLGTVGVAAIMWSMLCAAFGERLGHEVWRKFIIVGVLCSVFAASWGES